MSSKKSRKKFVPNTIEERIDILKRALRELTASHGSPCMCVYCEVLIFDAMAAKGEINLITGERKS